MVNASLNRARPGLRRTLAQGSALALVFAAGTSGGWAANIPQGGTVVNLPGPGNERVAISLGGGSFGAPTNTIDAAALPSTTTDVGIRVQQAKTVINWDEFNIGAGRSVNFSAAGPITNYSVLNRVVDTTATGTQILGALTSTAGGQIWVLNRAGVLFGATARIDTGSFVASTLDISNANFGLATTGSAFAFTRPTDADAGRQLTIDGATISVAAPALATNGLFTTTGPLLLVAPNIVNSGRIAAGGDVGLVVAQAATVQLSSTSILGIQIDAGTSLAANGLQLLTGSTTGGARVYAVAASQVDAVAALLNVQGDITATNATVGANGIVLSAGAAAGGAGGVTVTDAANKNRNTSIGGTAVLTTANNITAAANQDVLFGGTASIVNALASGASNLVAGRDVQLSGTGAIVASGAPLTVTAGRDVHLVSARSFNAATTLHATRDVLIDTLTGTTTFAANATFEAGRDIVVNAAQTLGLGAAASLTAGRDVTITLPALSATGALDVTAGDDIRITASTGPVQLASATTTGLGMDTEADGSFDIVVGSTGAGGMAAIATADSARDIVLTADTTATLGTAVATRDIGLAAATVSLADGLAGRDIGLTGSGAAGATRATVVTRARAGDDVRVVATNGATSVAAANASGFRLNAARTGFGAMAAVDTEADGSNVFVQAAEQASITGQVQAATDVVVVGASVAAASATLTAGDDVAVVARSGNAAVGVVTAQGTADSEVNDTTALVDASGGTINDPTKVATPLTRLAGSNAVVIASGNAAVTGGTASMAARDLRVVAGDTSLATLNSGTAGRDLLLLGGSAAGTGTLQAGDDVTVVARAGTAAIGRVVATGLGTDTEANDITALVDASGGTINDPTKAATPLTRLAGSNAVVIASGNASVTGGTTSMAARDLRVVAGDTSTATLNSGTAGRDLLLLGGSAAGTGTLQAGDDVTVVARAGNAAAGQVVATGLAGDTEADDTTALVDASGGTINDPTKAATSLTRLAGSNAVVIASGNASVTGGTASMAARDLRVVAGNTSTATLNSGTAGRDLLLLGGSAAGTGTLQAGDDVTVVARAGNAAAGQVVATGLAGDTEADDTTALVDASGGTINDPTKAATPLTRLAGSNAVVIASGNASVTGGTASMAARDLRVVAGDTSLATLNSGTAGRDLLLLGGSAAGTGTLQAGDDVTVVARAGTAAIGRVVATGLGTDTEANDITALVDASGGTINDPTKAATPLTRLAGSNAVVIASGNASVTGGTASMAARDLRVVAGDTSLATLNSGTAGRDLLLLGGSAAGTGTLQAGDDVTVVARAGNAAAGQVVATGLAGDTEADDTTALVDASGGTINDPTKAATPLTRLAGSNAVVIASGNAAVTGTSQSASARDLRVVAGGTATLDNGTAARDLLLLGGSAISNTSLTAGDDVTVVARAGTATVNLAGLTVAPGPDSEAGVNAATLLDASNGAVSDPYLWQGSTSVDRLAGRNIVIVGTTGLGATSIGDTVADTTRAVTAGGNASVDSARASGLVLVGSRNGIAGLADGTSGANIVINGSTATLGTGNAANDIIVSGGTASLADGTAGNDIFVLASSGNATATLARTLGTTDGSDTAVSALLTETGAEVISGVTGRRIDRIDGSNIIVEASGDVIAGTLSTALGIGRDVRIGALGSADVASAGALRDVVVYAGTGASGGALVANRDVTVLGATANFNRLVAGDDVVAVARSGAANVTTARAYGFTVGVDPVDVGTFGVPTGTVATGNEATAAETIVDLALLQVADPSGAGAISGLAGSNVVVVGSTGAAIGTGVAATDLKLATATGLAALDDGLAGQDILVLGNAVAVNVRASAGDDVALVARAGNIVVANGASALATGQAFDARTGVFSGAVGTGLSTEASDATALFDVSGSVINDPTKASAAALRGFAGSNVLAIASGNASVGEASAPRDVRVVAGSDAALGTGAAGRDLLLLAGGSATSGASLTAGDDVLVVSQTGATQVNFAGLAATPGTDSEAGNDLLVAVDASGAAIADPYQWLGHASIDTLAGNNIVLVGNSGVSATAAGTATLRPRQLRIVTVSGDVSLSQAYASGLVLIGSRQGSAMLSLGDSLADINVVSDMATATLTTGNASGTIVVTGASASGGSLTAGQNVSVTATAGDAVVDSATASAGSVSVTATGLASLATGDAGTDVLLKGANAMSATSLTGGNDVTVTATAGDATVNAATATAGTLAVTATGLVTLTSGNSGGSTLLSGATVNQDSVTAAQNVSIIATAGDAVLGAATATAGTVSVTATGLASLTTGNAGTDILLSGAAATGDSLTAGQNVTVNATGGDALINAATATTGTVSVTATGLASLTTGNAGSDILLTGASAAGNSLTATRNVTVNATGGDAVIDAAAATTGTVSVTATGLASLTTGDAGTDVLLKGATATGDSLTATRNVTVNATGGDASITAATATNGTVSVTATGLASLTTGNAGTDLLLTGVAATGDSLTAGQNLTVDATGGDAMINAATATNGTVSVTATGLASLTTGNAGTDLLLTGAAATGDSLTAGQNLTVDATGGDAMINAATATNGTVSVTATGLASLTTGNAGIDVLLMGATASSDSLTATRNVTVNTTGGDATINAATATNGTVSVTATGVASLTTGNAGIDVLLTGASVSGNSLTAARNVTVSAMGGDANINAATATNGTVSVTATGLASLTTGNAGTSITLTGGTATADSLTAAQDVTVSALAGDGSINAVTATAGTVSVTATGLASLTTGNAGTDVLLTGATATGDNLTAGQDVTVDAGAGDGSINAATATAGTVSVTATGLASLTTGNAGTDVLLTGATATGDNLTAGRDVTVDAGAGDASIIAATATAGTVSVTATGLASLTTGNAGADILLTGATAASDNSLVAAGGVIVQALTGAATVNAATATGGDLRVEADTDAALATGTAGGDLLLLAGDNATSATSLTAGDDVAVVARRGNATLAVVRATGAGLDSEASDTTPLADALGAPIDDPSVMSAPPVLATLAQSNILVAASGDAIVADAQAPRDIRIAAGGDARLTTGDATTRDIVLDAGAVAGANRLTAGRNLIVTSSDIDLFSVTTPVALAPLLNITGGAQLNVRDRNGTAAATNAVLIGDVTSAPAATATWALNNAELGAIQAASIDIDAGARTVTIGDATPFTAASGSPPRVGRFAVASTGEIDVVGAVSFNGADRVLTLGGRTDTLDTAADHSADVIKVVTSLNLVSSPAQANGQLLADGGTIRLRSRVIVVGLPTTFQTEILPSGSPISQALVASNFFLNTQSSLYRPLPSYLQPTAPAKATYLRANSLVLSVGDYALLQNTDLRVQPGGGTAVGTIDVYSTTPGDPTVALFGSINGRDSVAASLQVQQITLHDVSPVNVRVNGCIVLQGSGCVVNNVVIPDPRITNPSSAFLLTVAPSLTVPIDLVSGATNEALWRTDRCEDDDTPCPKPESNR